MKIRQLQQDEDTRKRRSPSGERKLVKQGNIPQNIIIPQVIGGGGGCDCGEDEVDGDGNIPQNIKIP